MAVNVLPGRCRVGVSGEGHVVSTLGDAEDHRSVRARRIHNGPNIVHSLLQGRNGNPVGHSRAAFVETNHTREGAKPLKEVSPSRLLPSEFEMRNETGDENKVALTRTR
jgi:CTP:molybdopterin cytidylyltransferase MocA